MSVSLFGKQSTSYNKSLGVFDNFIRQEYYLPEPNFSYFNTKTDLVSTTLSILPP